MSADLHTLSELSKLTAAFRERCALRHDAVRRRLETELGQVTRASQQAAAPETRAQLDKLAQQVDRCRAWHSNRARGQRDRFERVQVCGSGKAQALCSACGAEHELPLRCDVWRACVACRQHAALERRARFGRGRVQAVDWAHRRGLLRRLRRGGRWTEKHVTLTVPHIVGDSDPATVKLRVRVMFEAWRIFNLTIRAKWKPLGNCKPSFYRFFEWTAGHDLLGHPHFHVWMLCPFLEHQWLAETWGECLRRVGASFEGDPIVDVRQVKVRPAEWMRELIKRGKKGAIQLARLELDGRGGEDLVQYADGWSVVDVANGREMPPEILAALYESLEARRVTQSSLGLLPPHELAECVECGEQAMTVRILEPTLPPQEVATGPPD